MLRLTRVEYRSPGQMRAEMDFLAHLVGRTCAVNAPIATPAGSLVESVECTDGRYCASMVSYVPGRVVGPTDGELGSAAVAGWGAALGALHAAARSYRPAVADRRWHWNDEILFRMASELIPARCAHLRRGLDATVAAVAALPTSDDVYGMVHGDHGPQNFHIDRDGRVTTFDFGNCCYQFFASDVAIALGVLPRYCRSAVGARRDDFLAGYRAEMELDAAMLAREPLFADLRLYYVYLARLHHYGAEPGEPERAAELARLEARLARLAL